MESEKVKEIKKGLKCCSTLMDNNATSEEQDNSCNECPYRLNYRCSWNLDSDALTLINELESENERLSNALEDNVTAYEDGFQDGASLKGRIENKWVKENQQLKDRIAELEKDNEILKGTKDRLTFADRIELVNNAVEIQLKQFGKKFEFNIGKYLKKKYSDYQQDSFYYIVDKSDVDMCLDETLKEFIK